MDVRAGGESHIDNIQAYHDKIDEINSSIEALRNSSTNAIFETNIKNLEEQLKSLREVGTRLGGSYVRVIEREADVFVRNINDITSGRIFIEVEPQDDFIEPPPPPSRPPSPQTPPPPAPPPPAAPAA